MTLQCALPAEGGSSGTLYIAANETSLVALQEAAQVLAGQAGLTLQRIALSREIDRRNSEAYFRTLVLNTADVILVVDATQTGSGTPARPRPPSSKPMTCTAPPCRTSSVTPALMRCGAGSNGSARASPTSAAWSGTYTDPTAGEALVEASCRDLRGEPTVDGLVITLRDVTESRRMQDELYRRATYDALTGLPNREVFLASAQLAIDRAVAVGQFAGVLVAELDDFRMVNNTMGHAAGDELLAMVGSRLTSALARNRAGGTGRRGGLDGRSQRRRRVRGLPAWNPFGRRTTTCRNRGHGLLRRSVRAQPRSGDRDGLCRRGHVVRDDDSRELLRQADLAVAVAKDAGKGRSLQYEASLHAAVADRLRLRSDLEQAVAAGDFVLELPADSRADNPPYRGFRGACAVEPPDPRAPGAGRVHRPGRGQWIDRAAGQLGAAPRHRGGRRVAARARRAHVRTSASMSRPGSYGRRALSSLVRAELAAAGLPPDRLTLEITESLLVRGGGVDEELAELRADGVRVAIDDFGTGFSSLSYLRQLPVDVLKLDKSFVDTVTSSHEQYAILTAVTQLARTLDLDVVAEGIETDEELDVLSAMGCGFGQGYLLSRPMSYVRAIRWLRDEVAVPATRGRTSP